MKKNAKKETKEEFTGRYLVLLPEGTSAEEFKNELNASKDVQVKSSLDYENEFFTESDLDETDGIILDKIGVAILNDKPVLNNLVSTLEGTGIIVEPERVVYAINLLDEKTQNYVEGYRDAINQLADVLIGDDMEQDDSELEDYSDAQSVGSTWGLRATMVTPTSFLQQMRWTGNGIKVAILDTGFDLNHPDFINRPIVSKSFITGESVQDEHGHGTHCTGTACGGLSPAGSIERYGIAYKSSIYIGKVLNNAGRGADGGILAGINWAVANGCEIVSMSLGGTMNSAGFSAVFENAAARALNSGTLIIAAAGNSSSRPNNIRAVSHPANCPSIMAVGALDSGLNCATFSNGGLYATYGSVDIAGPGVGVFSSTKMPAKHSTMNGTSMATPHVAGIAALWAESTGLRGINLWKKLVSTAKGLPLPTRDVGAGLVQAPYTIRYIRPIPFPRYPELPKFPVQPPIIK